MGDCRKGDGSRLRELGLLTTQQVCDEYAVSEPTLRRMRKGGALHAKTPTGRDKPLYYEREELDAVILGAVKA